MINHFNVISDILYIRRVLQPPLPVLPKHFPHPQKEALWLGSICSLSLNPFTPSNHHFVLCLNEYTFSAHCI